MTRKVIFPASAANIGRHAGRYRRFNYYDGTSWMKDKQIAPFYVYEGVA